jgi:tol-pal system beta propeller repeat protein TolB
MCRKWWIFLIVIFVEARSAEIIQPAAALPIIVRNANTQKMGICVGYLGEHDIKIAAIAEDIARDMRASGQFHVDTMLMASAPKKMSDITAFLKQGYHFVIIIHHASRKRDIEYRCYDTTMGRMIKEASGRYRKQKTRPTGWAHHIAQKIWPVLTGNQGMFTSKLAYSKEVGVKHGIPITNICMADYDGTHEQVLVRTPTVNVAPRWGVDLIDIQLFYSEQGATQMRLMQVDGRRRKRHITGAHDESSAMHLVIAPDGRSAAYCASRGDGSCQIYLCKGGVRRNITNNDGNNMSVTFSSDSKTLYFCSDSTSGQPQIFAYQIETGKLRRITNGGYCASPSAHPFLPQIMYAKMMENGDMQIMLYDETTGEHKHMTNDGGTKDECCWSPCGNYIAYEWRSGRRSVIKVLNLLTGEHHAVTPSNARCSYPAWSPCFLTYPI